MPSISAGVSGGSLAPWQLSTCGGQARSLASVAPSFLRRHGAAVLLRNPKNGGLPRAAKVAHMSI